MKFVFVLGCLAACVWAQEGRAVSGGDGAGSGFANPHGLPAQGSDQAARPETPDRGLGQWRLLNNGASFRNYLTEIASHGFLAIAIGPPQAPPPAREVMPKGQNVHKQAGGAPATKSSQLIDAINWAIAENGRKDSPYYGKLDISKIAVMGQSCGGIQSLAVAEDPRIKLIGIWNSGILNMPLAPGTPAMEDVRKEQLEKLHSPIFYITGDKSDIAFENGMDDFKRITKVPAFHAYKDGVGHGGTYSQPDGGEFGKIAVAMLQWQLKGDQNAAKMFVGANCGLCQDPKWHVSDKGLK